MNESNLVLHGLGQMSLSVDRNCLILEMRKINEQVRVIPLAKILCIEVSEPKDDHRGYIYFRTPDANKTIKPSVTGRDVNADDDMVFFDGDDNYQVALKIQDCLMDFYETR
ncbi:hypothetical protein LJC56_03100 [Christensenellaceae bacterium OttesenSCG-928-K19]|nr:hypothetical protein [Christensenellaceae bacterium OttesenSCG-928-K19]